jgi:DNA-binding NarL/FixJ family response regulator
MKDDETLNSPVISVLVIDDHYLVRNGLKSMLLSLRKALPMVVSDADSGEKALQLLSSTKVDLVIADYQLEGLSGPETIRRILRFKPGVTILALSNYNEFACIEAMMDAGASGYILKSVYPAQLLTAIQTVLAGKKYFCNEVALVLLAAADNGPAKMLASYKITSRELEVLLLISQGMTNAGIARQLSVSRRTIDTHRQNLLVKLKVSNTAALLHRALQLGLLK